MHRRKVAIFDIDGTIFRSSLLIEVTQALIDAGVFPSTAWKGYDQAYKAWRDRRGSYESYIDAVVVTFARHIKGVDYRRFVRVSEGVVRRQKDKTYRYTRDLIAELKKKKYYLLAISKSPKGIVEPFAKKLGFDKVYGFLYETDIRGRYTGKLMYEDLMSDKAKILQHFLAKEELPLAGSVGVGDTESDIAFLKLVDRPVCFNPNAKLYAHARRAGWEVVVERKDVVYRMP